MKQHIVLYFIIASISAVAQAPHPQASSKASPGKGPSELSPAAAYREAMRPVEITHSDVANWSDIEQSALGVAVRQASEACGARTPADYAGSALVDLSRLCALGLAWPVTATAAKLYIQEDALLKPRLAEAYALLVSADLQLKDEHNALDDSEAMLAAVPYASLTAGVTAQAITYMHLLYTIDAVELATKRQPLVLTALHSASTETATTPDAQSIADLYRQGLVLAELQQLQGNEDSAQMTLTALESALPATSTNDDMLTVNRLREHYSLLGKPLPMITPLASLAKPPHIPKLPERHAITALLLFPDWCAQCIRIAKQVPSGMFSVNQHYAYIYGLLAETVTPQEIPKTSTRDAAVQKDFVDPAFAAASLRGTSTLTGSAKLLDIFRATDVPLLIFTDSQGIVRLFDVANESAFQPGDTVDSAVALIGENWPAAPK